MNDVYHLLFEIPLTIALGAIIVFFARNWIVERLKISLQRELEEFKSDLLWDQKIRVEAGKVAEYLSLVNDLPDNKSTLEAANDYRRANQLTWELAMWLPDETYKSVVKSIVYPDEKTNTLSTIIQVREILLGNASGNLNQDNIAFHAPGAGQRIESD